MIRCELSKPLIQTHLIYGTRFIHSHSMCSSFNRWIYGFNRSIEYNHSIYSTVLCDTMWIDDPFWLHSTWITRSRKSVVDSNIIAMIWFLGEKKKSLAKVSIWRVSIVRWLLVIIRGKKVVASMRWFLLSLTQAVYRLFALMWPSSATSCPHSNNSFPQDTNPMSKAEKA